MQTMPHLTGFERQNIEYYRRLGRGIREIGRRIGRDHSVISREVRRNIGSHTRYLASAAILIEEKRRQRRKGRKLEKNIRLHDHVVAELRRGRSPDVIAGCMKLIPVLALKGTSVSTETIYRYIYDGDGKNEGLFNFLRNKQQRRQKHSQRKTRKKPRIPERISIHTRPEEVGLRTVFGHWESDTVIYSKQKEVLSVQIERKSRLLRFHKTLTKSAEDTEHAIRKTVESLPEWTFKTMTFDNGSEGSRHTIIRDEYDIKTYFCDTYSSWQKGAVENMNRIIRRFLPKTKDLSVLTDREIYDIQELINDTPRKCLGYRTPNEVAAQYLTEGGALLA